MALSAPCAFDNTEHNLTPRCFSLRSMRSSSSATTLDSLLSEEEVVSDPGSVVSVHTSLNTDLLFKISGRETISKVKDKVIRSHSSNFPTFGEIKINDIKVKCRSCFHSLEDSMPMRMILNERKHALQLYVDASSSVEHHGELDIWSDTVGDSESDNDAISQEESGDLQTPCSICLRGLDNNSLIATKPAVVADTGKISGNQHGVSEHGDKKRKKPTPKKISSRKKDPKGKMHMSKQVRNSVPTFESRAKPNEENFPTGMARKGTLQSYSSNKIASSSQKALGSNENSSNDSTPGKFSIEIEKIIH